MKKMPWRSNTLPKLNFNVLRRSSSILVTVPSPRHTDSSEEPTPSQTSIVPATGPLFRREKGLNLMVTIVIVEAKGLPDVPDDGSSHGLYCKFRLGSQSYKSKSVTKTYHPQWRERFKLHLSHDPYLRVTLCDKGKRKTFMGSCVLDLSHYEKERTHDIWLELDGGYGLVHLSITMCNMQKEDTEITQPNVEELKDKYAFYNLDPDLEVVGQVWVKVMGAKGLPGKPSAYCTLTLENEKIETPSISSSEPRWNKGYIFNVYDVTSVLDLKVMDNSLNSILNDFLGRVSIPLLRIADGEPRWYALKDANKRKSAKGNCPRILLELSIIWNPVTASLKLFRPRRVKYIQKPPKFNVALVYKNVRFIRDLFVILYKINEKIKYSFEWDDRDYSFTILSIWVLFWCYFSAWTIPLLTLLPFLYFWYFEHKRHQELTIKTYHVTEDTNEHNDGDDTPNEESFAHKIQDLREMTLTITDGIEYLVSVAERLYNLASFKVPYLSFLTMIILIGASVVFYYIPFKYLMILLGIYKFGRKQLNPGRTLNNDLLDFISRIPDNKILKDWKELAVPEPHLERRIEPCLTTPY